MYLDHETRDNRMESNSHRIFDILNHVWPYLSGAILIMFAGTKLWWYDRRETKRRIVALEVLAENLVNKDDLQECRDDVRQVDDDNLEKIFTELRKHTANNAQQHQDIMNKIIDLKND